MTAPSAPVKEGMVCEVCTGTLRCRWTDTHGVGACLACGAPYRLFVYGANKKRLDMRPTLMIAPKWVELLRRYWQEHHRNVDPGAYNFPSSSYEVATQADVDNLGSWIEAHKDELPV